MIKIVFFILWYIMRKGWGTHVLRKWQLHKFFFVFFPNEIHKIRPQYDFMENMEMVIFLKNENLKFDNNIPFNIFIALALWVAYVTYFQFWGIGSQIQRHTHLLVPFRFFPLDLSTILDRSLICHHGSTTVVGTEHTSTLVQCNVSL